MRSTDPPKSASRKTGFPLLERFTEQQRKVLLAGLIAFFLLAASTTLLLAYYVFEPQIGALFTHPTSTLIPTVTPTPSPTPQCVRPTLSLGTNTYPVEVLAQDPSGALPTPPQLVGAAWWVSDTFSPFVFIVKPSLAVADLQTQLEPGDPLAVQWADCWREEFALTEIQSGQPDAGALLAQNSPGIVIIVQPQRNAPEYVIYVERPALINPATPEPTQENAINVEITFGETVISADQATLQTSFTIINRGANPITITNDDLSLTAEGQQPLSPLSVEPALPQEILPDGSLSLVITVTNPGGHTAVLQVLDITLDLYY
jgi:hypothetical protein